MRGVVVACALLVALGSSGCFVEDDPKADTDDVAGTTTTGAGTTSGASKTTNGTATGAAPVITNVSANATGLSVAITVLASDADNDTLTFSIAFGDNSTLNGTFAPATGDNVTAGTLLGNATHAYAAPGSYNVTVTVSDGKNAVNRTIAVQAGSAAVQDPIHLEGTVECLPTMFADGELAGGQHAFAVLAGQQTMVITLTYANGDFDDIDYTATDAAGEEHEAAEAGPEPPMTITAPVAGDWEIDVIGYSCLLDLDYTIDITFA